MVHTMITQIIDITGTLSVHDITGIDGGLGPQGSAERRCATSCPSREYEASTLREVADVVDDMCTCEAIEVVRIKDRFHKPSPSGWRLYSASCRGL